MHLNRTLPQILLLQLPFAHWFSLGLMMLLCSASFAQQAPQSVIELQPQAKMQYIGQQAWFLEDHPNSLTIHDILSPQQQERFVKYHTDVFSFEPTTSAYWLKFRLRNTKAHDAVMELASAFLDSIWVYEVEANGQVHFRQSGDHLKFSDREVATTRFLFHLPVRHDSISTYYVRVESTQPLMIPVRIGSMQSAAEYGHRIDFIQGMYFGLILLIAFYNLFIYFSVRDKIYLLYVGYSFSVMLFMAFIFGYFYEFLWPNIPFINHYAIVSSGFTILFAVLFTRNFLNTADQTPKLDIGLKVIAAIGILVVLLNLAGVFIPALMLAQAMLLVMAIYFLIIGFVLYRKGFRPAKFYLLAWTSLIIGVVAAILESLSLFYISLYISPIQLGSALEVALLSFALADKINTYKQDLFKAQQASLEAVLQRQKLIAEQNEMLERKVAERTLQISEANEELNQTNEELQSAIDMVTRQKEIIQTSSKKTLDSIKYAQRIQAAILPSEANIKEFLPDSFLLYKPRDIVAGDFYFAHQKGSKIYLAVADCTGHGVPGAFMSMIGSRLLYEAIAGLHIEEPSEILNYLNDAVIRTLRQKETRTHDGMDMGLVLFDTQTRELHFSGAHHHLLYFVGADAEAQKLNGTRSGIGGHMLRTAPQYQTQSLKLQAGQEITAYLFTDGYPDQMGGPYHRKYTTKYFREKLSEIRQMAATEQQSILETELTEWQQELPQSDDILVLGFRWKF